MVVLLNLLLYRNSFCGIFRQASVLQASCHSASFQGMEVVKGSNKKGRSQAEHNTGCCFQLAAGSLRLPHGSYRHSTDVVLSLYACFSLYLPWKSNVRECSRFPCAFPGAAGGVGWCRAAWERPCLYPSLPLLLGILRPCVETLGSWSMVGWAGASTQALGFHSVFPERNTPRMRALHSKGNAVCGVLVAKPKDNVKALLLWESLLQFLSSGFQALAGELPGWWDTIPTDTVEIQRKINKIRHPNLPPANGGRGGSGAAAAQLPGPSLLTSGLIPLSSTPRSSQ